MKRTTVGFLARMPREKMALQKVRTQPVGRVSHGKSPVIYRLAERRMSKIDVAIRWIQRVCRLVDPLPNQDPPAAREGSGHHNGDCPLYLGAWLRSAPLAGIVEQLSRAVDDWLCGRTM